MSLNYPLNPDTSFESFFLTKESDVQATFGTTYSQNELAPMNYNKIMLACVAGTLTYAPIRELVFISDPRRYDLISDETTNGFQGANLKELLNEAYLYWKTDLLIVAPFQCVGGIVTEISTRILTDASAIPAGDFFQIETKLKINWLVIASKSSYA